MIHSTADQVPVCVHTFKHEYLPDIKSIIIKFCLIGMVNDLYITISSRSDQGYDSMAKDNSHGGNCCGNCTSDFIFYLIVLQVIENLIVSDVFEISAL